MDELNLKDIADNFSILPSKEINLVGLKSSKHFLFENQQLPREVKLLIDVTAPGSINSGNVFFNGEELFWISSPLKIVLFNPKKPSNVIDYDIDYPVQIVFSYNLYLILTHKNSFVTLLNFPKSFSQMFDNNDSEDHNFYIHTKNRKSILNSKKYPKMLRPMPSSYVITSAQGNFIGCSDGVIRTFKVVGHQPESNFLIKKAVCGLLPSFKFKASPIISLKISGRFLYALDASYNLSAYLISSANQISQNDNQNIQNDNQSIQNSNQAIQNEYQGTQNDNQFIRNDGMLIPIGSPINIPGKFVNMAPFCESVIITKQMGSTLIGSSIISQSRYYRVKNNGVVVPSGFKSDHEIKNYSDGKRIYLLNTNKKSTNNRISVIWPISSTRTSGNTVIIYLDYYYYRNEDEYNADIRKHIEFECVVKEGDILTFAFYQFKPPIPFIDMKYQFFPFKVIGNQSEKINFIIPKKDSTENKKSISVRPIGICVHEFDDPNFQEENSIKSIKNSCLCIIGDYPLCPSTSSNHTIESLFGIPNITHSIWGGAGSLFCIIYSPHPNFGNLLTMQFGVNPVAQIMNITGSIFGYSTINESDNRQTSLEMIDKCECDSLFIFTSNGLLKISLNKDSSYMNRVEMNSIKHLFPFLMKKATIKNLSDFHAMLEKQFTPLLPEKKEKEKKRSLSYQAMNSLIQVVINNANENENEGENEKTDKNSKTKKTDEPLFNLHLYNLITNYPLIESDLSSFNDKQATKKAEPGIKRISSSSTTGSFTAKARPQTPNFLNDKDNDKQIHSFYEEFREYCVNKDINGIDKLVKAAITPNTKVQRLKIDCLSVWITEEINSLEDQFDEKTIDYLEGLSHIQEKLMEFNTEMIIFE